MAEIISLQIDAKVGDAVNATKTLKQQLREATNEAQKLAAKYGETSTEAINAAKKTAILKEKLADFKGTVDALNPEAKFKAIGQVAQGIAGGFTAATGAMALFGVKSEDTEKALLKVQGALALSEGLNTIMGLGDAFTNLKTVAVNAFNAIKGSISATGIGLLVVALGVVIAKWDDIKAAIGGAEAEADKYLENLKKQNAELDKQYEKELKIAKAKGKDTTILEQQIAVKKLVKVNEEASESFKKLTSLQKEYNIALDESLSTNEAQQTRGAARANRIKKEIEAEEKKYYTLKQLQEKSIEDAQIARFTSETKAEKDKLAVVESEKKQADAVKEDKSKHNDQELEDLKIYGQRLKDAEVKQAQELSDELVGIAQILPAVEADINKKRLYDNKVIADATIQLAQETLNGITAIGEIGIKNAKKLEQFQKGVALAQLAIDTATAISGLTAISFSPTNGDNIINPLGPYIKLASGIAVILSNVAKAKKLLSSGGTTSPSLSMSNGGGGSGGSSSASGGANLGGATPNQQSTLLQNANINSSSLNQNYVKAVVVETDITDAQNRIQGIQNKSKFG